MVNLFSIRKKKCLELFEELNHSISKINEIKKILEDEVVNSEDIILYSGNIKYKDLNFKALSFNQIRNMLNYIKSDLDFNDSLKVDKLLEQVKLWFYNKLLEDSFISNKPKSYLLSTKLDELIFDLKAIDKDYFQVDISVFGLFNIDNLNSLHSSLMNDLYQTKRKLNDLESKEQLFSGFKADSDYIKRNKK